MESKRFANSASAASKSFFLPAAISRSVAALGGIEPAELSISGGLCLRLRRQSRRAAIELDQRLHRGRNCAHELHRCFKFLAPLFRERQCT